MTKPVGLEQLIAAGVTRGNEDGHSTMIKNPERVE
jgi:hypothetical protein